jgi:hypothetical protein
MHSFKDSRGRSWNVEITVAALKRVKATAGIDVGAIVDSEKLYERLQDPLFVADVAWAVVGPQAGAAGCQDAENFANALDGKAAAAAYAALLEEFCDFFSPCRPFITSWVREGLALRAAEIEKRHAAEAAAPQEGQPESSASGGGSASSPGSPASIPAPSRSVS